MQKVYEELTNAFRKNRGEISPTLYNKIVSNSFLEDEDTSFLLLQSSGYPIDRDNSKYILKTYKTPYRDQKFCVIDIETNGSKPEVAQVIEVGALIVQNGKIIDKFDSLVYSDFIPEYVSKITGISRESLINAPKERAVLNQLRIFMQDTIFVAHNANFDYGFLNYSFKKLGLGDIGNQKFCSIDLAKRTIESEKYGLAFLNESLELGVDTHHRAYSDALTTVKLLDILFKNLPKYVKSSDELIRFSISSRKERTNKKKHKN